MGDIRDGWRSIAATPIASILVILSLALGIGANIAVFSLLNAITFRPLPGRDPGGLYYIDYQYGGPYGTYGAWQHVRDRAVVGETLAWRQSFLNLSAGGPVDLVNGARVSGEFFDVLGVGVLTGRALNRADDRTGGGPDGPAAVISYRLWQERFGSARDTVGRTLSVDKASYTIAGVMPPPFVGIDVGFPADVIVPLGVSPASYVTMMARLRPGQTPEAATAELRAAVRDFREATRPPDESAQVRGYTERETWSVVPAAERYSFLKNRYQRPLYALMFVVALVLLIACANVATLLAVRVMSRQAELSVRLALGATRTRIARQLVTESLLLSTLGIAGGIAVAAWSGPLVVRQFSNEAFNIAVDLAPTGVSSASRRSRAC